MLIDNCSDCEVIVNSQANNASYDSQYDLWFIDENEDGSWTTNNPYYPFLENPAYDGPDEDGTEGNGIPDFGEPGVNYAGFIIVDAIERVSVTMDDIENELEKVFVKQNIDASSGIEVNITLDNENDFE